MLGVTWVNQGTVWPKATNEMFIDTSIFVSARNLQAPASAVARAALVQAQDDNERVCISRQVMREYLLVMTRPQTWSRPLSMTEALNDFAWMETTFDILEDGRQVMDMLFTLCRDVQVAGKQIHDANIVATMLAHGERRLLSFNSSDFRRYEHRIELVRISETSLGI